MKKQIEKFIKYIRNLFSICREPEWYENIPEKGILCWVHDYDQEAKVHINIINKYLYDYLQLKFKSTTKVNWRYAKPLTEEEVKEYLYETRIS